MTDLFQDAALRCLNARISLNPVRPYSGKHFFQALRWAKIDDARRRSRIERRSLHHFDSEKLRERIDREERSICDRSDPTRAAEHNERFRQVTLALDCLSAAQRNAIVACYLREVPESEYAVEIGATKSKVRALIYRGLQKIRGLLVVGKVYARRRQSGHAFASANAERLAQNIGQRAYNKVA